MFNHNGSDCLRHFVITDKTWIHCNTPEIGNTTKLSNAYESQGLEIGKIVTKPDANKSEKTTFA